MQKTAACRLCGRGLEASLPATRRYCDPCRAVAAAEAARTHRVRCKECGRTFQTPTRAVRYCSAACRKKRLKARRAQTSPGRARDGMAECRECGGQFVAGMRPGNRSYCSAACRTKGTRARMRDYMRRYLVDPKKRALHSARAGAAKARRRAAAARDRERRVRCRMCGGEFSTSHWNAWYCSDPCREKGRMRSRKASELRRRDRRRAARAPAAGAAK